MMEPEGPSSLSYPLGLQAGVSSVKEQGRKVSEYLRSRILLQQFCH